VQLAVESIHQIFGCFIAMDSLQHQAYNEIHGIDPFYDN